MTNTVPPTQIIYEFEFQFESQPTLWLRTDVTVQQALDCIKTGLLKNLAVARVKLFSISESNQSISFVYDIAAAKSGNIPWSLLPSL
jgi:hypothetical protein